MNDLLGLLFTVHLLWFGTLSQVDTVPPSGHTFDQPNWILEPPGPAPEGSSLVLAVEATSRRIYLTNNEFIASQKKNIYSEFLIACPPAPGSRLASKSETMSESRNALFIEKVYKTPETPDKSWDLIDYRCKHPVKPSVMRMIQYKTVFSTTLYSVGYEVYLGEDEIESYDVQHVFKKFSYPNGFAWFNVYTIAFDHQRGKVLNVFSSLFAYKTNDEREAITATGTSQEVQPVHVEAYYSLGIRTFCTRFNLPEIYGRKNQEEVFGNVPVLLDDSTPIKHSYMDAVQNRYLGKLPLVHPDDFWIPLLKQTTKTFGNIAPMWIMVNSNAWRDLKMHVKYLAEGLKAIHVITGTYGTMKLADKEIYLGPNNTVKVPAAFYKIVSYSPNENEKYNMLIVTSNNPYDETDRVNEFICEENRCDQFGWENIQQKSFALGRTTCCELTKRHLDIFELGYMRKMIDKPLNLNEVPHWNAEHLTLNLKKYILNQKNGKFLDKPADDEIYRNDKNIVVEDQDDEVIFSNLIFVVNTNYEQLYFPKNTEMFGTSYDTYK